MPGYWTDDSSVFVLSPYERHQSVCEYILIKLGYHYDANDKFWFNQSQTLFVSFLKQCGQLHCDVRDQSSTLRTIVDEADYPLVFFSNFLGAVAKYVQVKQANLRIPVADHYVSPDLSNDQILSTLNQRFTSFDSASSFSAEGNRVNIWDPHKQ
jgi:hypothetical protein